MKLIDSMSLLNIQIFPRVTTDEFYEFILRFAVPAMMTQTRLRILYINRGDRSFDKGLNIIDDN